MKKKSIVRLALILSVLLLVGIACMVIPLMNYKKNIYEYMQRACEAGLKDVKVRITGKYDGYDIYSVELESSNLSSFSDTEKISIAQSIDIVNNCKIDKYICNDDVYKIYPYTMTVSKNGDVTYDNYWDSDAYTQSLASNQCALKGCNEKQYAGSNFCSNHKCKYIDCKEKKMYGSSYCSTHEKQVQEEISSSGSGYTPSSGERSSINAEVEEYDDPSDFADDFELEFDNWDDAYEFWEEHSQQYN